MKRFTIKFSLLLVAILIISSCGRNESSKVFYVDDSDAIKDGFFGVIESFTSGVIAENETIQVRFCSGVTLEKQFGEQIPSSAFTIEPKIKGNAFWKDQQTVAFQFDESPKKQQVYNVKFNLSEFVETPKDQQPLKFNFLVCKQDFNIKDVVYQCNDMNSCSYRFTLVFANPIDPQKVISLIDSKTQNDFKCETSAISANQVLVTVSNIPRKNSTYDIDIKFDGKSLEIDNSIKKSVTIPVNNELNVINYTLNKTDKSIIIQFSNPLNKRQNLTGYIKISNTISYKTDISGNLLTIYCENNYQIKETFNVTIFSGIKDENGKTLNDDYSINNIVLNDLYPKVKWIEDGMIIPDSKNTTIYFDAIALKSVTLRIIRMYNDNVLSFLQENDFEDTYNIKRVGRLEKKIKLQLEDYDYSDWKTFPIKLSDYVNVQNGSMYQLTLDFDISDFPFAKGENKDFVKTTTEQAYWDNETYEYQSYYYDNEWWKYENDPNYPSYYNYVEIKKNIMVSDVAITAKTANEGILDVFVRKISNANPIRNCLVQLFDYQKQVIAEGTTNKDGYCKIEYKSKPAFVVAQGDNNSGKSYIKLNNHQSLSLSKFDVSGVAVSNNINGFIYSNRDVWRPGDKLNLNLMISDNENQIPENFPVIMELYDANGRLYTKAVNNSSKGKIYAFEVPTAVSDASGIWSVEMKLGNQKFSKKLRVETLKPNRLKIDFLTPELINLSDNEEVKLSSKWLNGLKASNLSASVDVFLREGKTNFKQLPQYTFENVTSDFYGTEYPLFYSKLDADGSKMVSFNSLKDVSAPGFLNALFTIKVFEQSGDFSITSMSATISPFKRYVGVAIPETKSKYGSYYFTDENWNFEVAVVNSNGTLTQSDVYLDYNVYKLDNYWWWSDNNYDLGKYARGTYSKPIESSTLKSVNGKASFKLNIPEKKWGSYLIVIKDKIGGHIFSKVVYFDSPYYTYRSSGVGETPSLLSLKSDKTTYKVGEKIKISFPANKEAKAVITVESALKVIKTIFEESLNEDAVISIDATKDMVPNIYVYISLIQPYENENGLPLRMYGVVPITVEDDKKILNPMITMPENSASNSEIDIKISENDGSEMYYTISLVDEGILGMTNYKTPNPYKHFFSKQALNIRTWDNYNYVIDAYTGELNSVYAVGGDLATLNQETVLSERFSAIAFMLGPFKLEKGKSATHTLKIPEYLGSLRAMVVATDGKGAFGSHQKNITVKDAIMIIPTAPRVISPNDKFTLPIQILAPDLANKDLTLEVETENLNVLKNKKVTQKINSDGEVMVNVEMAVPETKGVSKITIVASSGSYSATSEIKLPIRIPYTVKYQATTVEIAPKATKEIKMNVNAINGTLAGELSVNTAVPVNLFNRLDYLIDYPHGCLEQTVSKAFPQLYLERLVDLDTTTKREVKENIEMGIANIKQFLKSDNSMSNWIGGNYVTPWTELYAAHFLVEAKKQGYNVSDDLLKGIIKYQSSKANAWRYNSDYPWDETIQAYRLFILCLNNSADVGSMNRFKDYETQYTLTKALIASSYALVGKKKIAEELFPVIDLNSKTSASNWYYTYGSNIRDITMMTYAKMLTDGNTDYVKQNIEQISQVLSSEDYMSTQTTAFSLFVLGKYSEMNMYKNAPISTLTKINDVEKTLNTNKPTIAYSFVPKNGENVASFTNNSEALVFASVYAKGTVAEYVTVEKGEGIKMSVNYFDKTGKNINPEKLKRNTDFYVEISIENPSVSKITENALTYMIPSGWEIINDRMFADNSTNQSNCNFIDFRDDRVNFYFDLTPYDKKTFKISLNASYSGSFTIPAVHCEDMYNDKIYYIIPAKPVVVE